MSAPPNRGTHAPANHQVTQAAGGTVLVRRFAFALKCCHQTGTRGGQKPKPATPSTLATAESAARQASQCWAGRPVMHEPETQHTKEHDNHTKRTTATATTTPKRQAALWTAVLEPKERGLTEQDGRKHCRAEPGARTVGGARWRGAM